MEKWLKKLPALALALVAVAAFAFNSPNKGGATVYGEDPAEGWIVVTPEMQQGVDYNCNSVLQNIHCLYSEPDKELGTPIGPSNREFELLY